MKNIVVVLIGVILSMVLVFYGCITVIGILLLGGFCSMFFIHKQGNLFIVMGLICWTVFSPQITRFLYIPFSGYIDEALVALMCTKAFVLSLDQRPQINKEMFIMCIFSSFVFFSSLLLQQPLPVIINFLFSFLKWIFVGWSSSVLLRRDDFNKIFLGIFYIVIIQTIIGMIQFFTFGNANIFIGSEIHIQQDAATGTFGRYGAHYMGNFMIIVGIGFLSFYQMTKKRIWMVGVLVSFIGFFITFTETTLVFLAVYLLSVVLFSKKIKISYKLLVVSIVIAVGGSLAMGKLEMGERIYEIIKNPKEITSSGKYKSIVLAKNLTSQDIYYGLAGHGAGSYSSGAAVKAECPLFKKYIKRLLETVTSTKDFHWSSATSLLVETGYMGFLLYYMIIGIVIMRAIKYRVNYAFEIEGICAHVAFMSVSFFMLFLSILSNAYELLPYVIPYGLLYGMTLKYPIVNSQSEVLC